MSNKLQTKLDAILEDKNANLLPEYLKAGVTCLGVKGNFEGNGGTSDIPVKLFETVEEMQADETAEEGDLAVVYREEIQNWDGSSAITSLTFPKTVVLPNKMTGSCYGYSRGDVYIDIDGSVEAKSASFRIYGDNAYYITYTSTNGLTYTRTDKYDDTIILANEPTDIRMYDFSEVCGYFMQVGGNVFDGLYNYVLNNSLLSYRLRALDINNFDLTKKASNVNIITSGIYTGEDMFTGVEIGAKFKQIVDSLVHIVQCAFTEDLSKLYVFDPSTQSIYIINDKFYIYAASGDSVLYAYDMATLEKTTVSTTKETITLPDGTSKNFYSFPEDAKWFTGSFVNNNAVLYYYIDGVQQSVSWVNGTIPEVDSKNMYTPAQTQLTINNENQLLPGVVAYGNKGVITGDGSIYNVLDTKQMMSSLGLNELYNASQYFDSFDIDIEKNKLYSVVKDDTSKYVFNHPYSMKEYPGFGFSYYLQDLLSLQYCTVTAVFSLNDYYTCIVAVVSSTTTTVSAGGADLIYAILDSDFNIIKTEKIIENQAAPNPSSVSYRICYADTSCYIAMDSPFNGRQDIIIKFDMTTKTYVGYNLHDEYTSDASSSSMIAVFHNDYLYVARHIYVNSTGIYYLYIKKFNANLELVDTISYTNNTLKSINVNAFAILGDNLYIRTTGYSSNVYYNCIFKVENPISTFVIDTTSTSQFSGILSDEKYLYVPCTGGTKKYDANLALIETLPIQTKCLSNAQYYNFEFVDYANYTCESFQRRMSIVNGKEAATNYYDPSNPFMDTKLADDSKIMSCEYMNSDTKFIQKYGMGESGSSKMVMLTLLPKVNAKFEEGLNENAYMVGISNGEKIYYTAKFNNNAMKDDAGTIPPEIPTGKHISELEHTDDLPLQYLNTYEVNGDGEQLTEGNIALYGNAIKSGGANNAYDIVLEGESAALSDISLSDMNEFTVEYVATWHSASANGYPFAHGNYGNGFGIAFQDVDSSILRFFHAGNEVPINNWELEKKTVYTFVRTSDSRAISLYIDGEYLATLEPLWIDYTSLHITFNNEENYFINPINQTIHVCRVLTTALSAEEIQERAEFYINPSVPGDPDLDEPR